VQAKAYLKAAILTYQPSHLMVGVPANETEEGLVELFELVNTLLHELKPDQTPHTVVLMLAANQQATVQHLLNQTKPTFFRPQHPKPLWASLNQAKLLLKPIALGSLWATLGLENSVTSLP